MFFFTFQFLGRAGGLYLGYNNLWALSFEYRRGSSYPPPATPLITPLLLTKYIGSVLVVAPQTHPPPLQKCTKVQ